MKGCLGLSVCEIKSTNKQLNLCTETEVEKYSSNMNVIFKIAFYFRFHETIKFNAVFHSRYF